MILHKIALAGAIVALALPVSALASASVQDPVAVVKAALTDVGNTDRAQVLNILSLEQNGQLTKEAAASQIDAILSTDEAKAVLAKLNSTSPQDDAGDMLAQLAAPAK